MGTHSLSGNPFALKLLRSGLLILTVATGLVTTGCATAPRSSSAAIPASADVPTIGPRIVIEPENVGWEPMAGFRDGRQRVVLAGDPSTDDGVWTYRIRTPNPVTVPPHTHPVDEFITVIQGTWYVGFGESFDEDTLLMLPAGSFVKIPAGEPHFAVTYGNNTTIQSSGTGTFSTTMIPARRQDSE